ncbi:P27 family phage terminase small subunit [Priestia megaterium]|uniref:P27 family phage terminase small subunit n=1 Tax=Priestia megaterium TaxID=1404 RepID=A0A6H1P2V4_PRIMG|nr:P27 family phage terminase small subunit [Priestia megaterium]QIZ07611.1 P27 family phage terminase small subunit [Priestia megaterium]
MCKIENQTKANMQRLGIYRPEFDQTVQIYSGLIKQYNDLLKELKESKFKVIEPTTRNNDSMKKSPLIGVLETLRKDILTYSNCLGLTPMGLRKINDEMKNEQKKLSKLEEALINLN